MMVSAFGTDVRTRTVSVMTGGQNNLAKAASNVANKSENPY